MVAEPVTNSEVFLWALFELDGSETFVDVEDVFLQAFKLAPQRLSWRTRSDLPDLKKCSKALRDAEAKTPQLLVKSGGDLRRLTVDGQKWIEDNFERLAAALGTDRVVQAPRSRKSSRLLSEATRSDAFRQWQDTGALSQEKWRYAELLRCSPDSNRSVWKNRIETLKSAAYAAKHKAMLDFLDDLVNAHSDWF